VLNYNSSTTYG